MYFILTYIFSFGLGLIFKDQYLLGSLTMYLGFLQTYFMAYGKWYEEFIGMLGTIASSVLCSLSGMYATAIFSLLVYIPLSIFSMVNWKKNAKDNEVNLNEMTVKKSILTLFLVVVATALVSFLLSLIPTQHLAVLDTAGDILNISGIILIALRYKEGWLIWVLGSLVDLVTWIVVYQNHFSNNAIMMIIMSIAYIFLNLWGYLSFIKIRKKQRADLKPAQ